MNLPTRFVMYYTSPTPSLTPNLVNDTVTIV